MQLFIGLISGTSINSIDAVVVDLSGSSPQLIIAHEHQIPAAIRSNIFQLARGHGGVDALDRLAQLDSSFARLLAEAVTELLEKADLSAASIQAIGSHGQTIWHAPDAAEPYTVQIGNPSLLAELTGIQTVADFRRRDIAAGGQGAPLAPAFHKAFFHDPNVSQVVVNIGGIANITVLPTNDRSVTGFDTGPGNTLMDAWIYQHRQETMDQSGAWAASGRVIDDLLEYLLQDAYFHNPPPKSTGPEYFNLSWLQNYLSARSKPVNSPEDIQATLTALSAHSIAHAIKTYTDPNTLKHVLVCGGGVHNLLLLQHLQDQLPTIPVLSTAACGVDPDYMEAIGFAWLAQQTLKGLPGNLPTVTGARGLRVLGGVYPV